MPTDLDVLVDEVRACQICAAHLPHGVRPILQVSASARILIVGQAPGRKVHESGIPFDDASGDRLRVWMGIDRQTFYDSTRIAIVPMGFCYPGTGKSGDLPPRPECAPKWRQRLINMIPNVELTLLVGKYAIDGHMKEMGGANLTDTVKLGLAGLSSIIALPHPSPRNNIWLKKNAWFEDDLVPQLRRKIHSLLASD